MYIKCLNPDALLFDRKLIQNNHLWCADSHHFWIRSVVFPALALVVLPVFHRATFSLKHVTCSGCHPNHICQKYCYDVLVKLNFLFFFSFRQNKLQQCQLTHNHSICFWSSIPTRWISVHNPTYAVFLARFIFEHPKAWPDAIESHRKSLIFFLFLDPYFHISCFIFIQGVLFRVCWWFCK